MKSHELHKGSERKRHNVTSVSLSFIQGLTVDYSLGDSLSDSSKEVLQRGREGARIYMTLG